MYGVKPKNEEEVLYVLERLNQNAIHELKLLYGKNYIQKALNTIFKKENEIVLIKLKKTNESVGVFGIIPIENTKFCGIFFLTTDNIHKGNKITLLKGANKQIKQWQQEYKLIMDSCLKSNETIIKWLTLLGFKPSEEYQDDNFQIYYKGDINDYK